MRKQDDDDDGEAGEREKGEQKEEEEEEEEEERRRKAYCHQRWFGIFCLSRLSSSARHSWPCWETHRF